jgi:hypothetical protein
MKIIFAFVLAFLLGLAIAPAFAGCYKCTTNNFPTTTLSGISSNDLSEAMATNAALGFHHFALHTKAIQWSISGSYESGNDENAFSGALAWSPPNHNVLLSGGVSTFDDDDWLIAGSVGGIF